MEDQEQTKETPQPIDLNAILMQASARYFTALTETVNDLQVKTQDLYTLLKGKEAYHAGSVKMWGYTVQTQLEDALKEASQSYQSQVRCALDAGVIHDRRQARAGQTEPE